jgi:hypothetical protein
MNNVLIYTKYRRVQKNIFKKNFIAETNGTKRKKEKIRK